MAAEIIPAAAMAAMFLAFLPNLITVSLPWLVPFSETVDAAGAFYTAPVRKIRPACFSSFSTRRPMLIMPPIPAYRS
jgi:hypothetical protein